MEKREDDEVARAVAAERERCAGIVERGDGHRRADMAAEIRAGHPAAVTTPARYVPTPAALRRSTLAATLQLSRVSAAFAAEAFEEETALVTAALEAARRMQPPAAPLKVASLETIVRILATMALHASPTPADARLLLQFIG